MRRFPPLRHLTIVLTFLFGLVSIISAVSRPLLFRFHFLQTILPLQILTFSRAFVLILGFIFFLLAYQLLRRSYWGWLATTFLVIVTIIGHLIKGLDVEEAFLGCILLVFLWFSRNDFRLKQTSPSVKRASVTLVVSFASVVLYTLLGFFFLDKRHFGVDFHLGEAAGHTLRLITQFDDPTLHPRTVFARFFLQSIFLTAGIAILYIIWVFFQLISSQPRISREELHRAQALVRQYGKSSLDFFKTYWDKTLFFSPDETAFLAYRVVDGVALVLGDPVAKDTRAAHHCLKHFLELADQSGWWVSCLQVETSYLSLYHRLGFHRIQIGVEAIVNLSTFSIEGIRRGKQLRRVQKNFQNLGCTVRIYQPTLSPELLTKLRRVNREWLMLAARKERIFSQGQFDPSILRDLPVATVETKEGKVLAFVTILPNYAPKAVTADLIRRNRQVPNGTMDFLFLGILDHVRSAGNEFFSLGLAPLAGLEERTDLSIPERTLKFFFRSFNFVYSSKGLFEFKDKFQPDWQPRYLLYRHAYQIPGIALALAEVTKPPHFDTHRLRSVKD